jgi:peptidoglycan hydrolase CwlO-like protein
MTTHRQHKVRSIVIAVVAAMLLCALPASAIAKTSAQIRSSIAAKRAAAAKAVTQLAEVRGQLTDALAQQSDADDALDMARQDLDSTNAVIDGLNGEILTRQSALDQRAVAMYTTGGVNMLEALMSASSLTDLFSRVDLFAFIQESDDKLVSGLTAARAQSESLQQQQALREAELISLRQKADSRAAAVKLAAAAQQRLTDSLSAEIKKLVRQEEEARAAEAIASAGGEGELPPLPYDPNTIISEATFVDSRSMSVAQIQAFLDAQGGGLRSYRTSDHTGASKTAAEMIAEAAIAWEVNPRVLLVTLQKEQSLISRPSPGQYALDWAMGCGKMDGSTLNQYQGFGNQIWGGARALHRNRSTWHPGISLTIDHAAVYPSNAATFTLYRYTPHFRGNSSFWRLYWHYFGDPAK